MTEGPLRKWRRPFCLSCGTAAISFSRADNVIGDFMAIPRYSIRHLRQFQNDVCTHEDGSCEAVLTCAVTIAVLVGAILVWIALR